MNQEVTSEINNYTDKIYLEFGGAPNFQIYTISNLYVGGDGAGITRGLMQASVNGVLIAREILKGFQ